jgi:hypothetical protein
MSYGACWFRAVTARTARDATTAAATRRKSRLRRLVLVVRLGIASARSSLCKDSFQLVD